MDTLLLPGMDGTGRLFAPLQRHLAPALRARVVSFPPDRAGGYEDLLQAIELPARPVAIVAESFSGPLGIRLAARHPDRVRALVLVATFARNPSALARWSGALLGPRLFRARPPDLALRWALLGAEARDDELTELRSVLASVGPLVLSRRLREIISVDVTEAFAAGTTPTLYIGGKRDRLVGAHVLAQMRALRADMEACVLDAPHLVLQRRPIEAARVISEFILKQRSGPCAL